MAGIGRRCGIVGMTAIITAWNEERAQEEKTMNHRRRSSAMGEMPHDILLRKEVLSGNLFQVLPLFFVAINADGTTLMMNDLLLETLGYSEDEVIGKDYMATFIKSDERDELMSVFTRLVKNHETTINENRIIAKDGKELLVEWHGRPVYGGDGRFEFFIGVGKDITDRRRAEEDLLVEKAYFEKLFESAPEAIAMVDNESRVLRVNREFTAMFGYEAAEIEGRSLDVFLAPDHLREEAGILTQAAARGEPVSVERIRRRKDGTLINVSILGAPIYISDVQVGVYGIYRDITERKQAEALYRTLADTSRAGVYIVQDGIFRYINYNAAMYAGYTTDEMKGRDSLSIVHPEDRHHAVGSAIRMLKGEMTRPYEFRIITKDGDVRWIMETLTSIEYQGRRAILGNSLDITEVREARRKLEESEERLQQIVESSPIPTFVIDSDHMVTHWNKACENLTGISAEKIMGTRRQWAAFYASPQPVMADLVLDNAPEDDIARYYDFLSRRSTVISGAFEVEKFFPDVGDNGKWLFITSRQLRDRDGGTIGAIESLQDVTVRKQAEELYATLANSSQNGVYVIQDNTTIFVNQCLARYLGYEAGELIGLNILDLVLPEDRHLVSRNRENMLRGSLQGSYEYQIVTKEGRVKWLMESIAPIIFDGRPAVLGNTVDITDRKEIEQVLKESEQRYLELSITDSLTSLYNRRHFHHQLNVEIERSTRYNRSLSLLLIDVDDFKFFNDTYGHPEGDEVLLRLARVIKKNIRASDTACRYGGEEFVVILPETDGKGGVAIAERIRERFKKEVFTPHAKEVKHVTVSIGVSQFISGEPQETFIARADELMYRAKKRGKDCVEFSKK
jgi:diguanylate cyclase (GGDEF)-like protein/PAS domain S-box-containing protein